MEIPENVFEAALTAAGEGDPPAPADAPDPAPEPGEVETPAEAPEAPAEGGGEGEAGEPAGGDAPAAEPAATPAPAPTQTFTAEQVSDIVAAAIEKLSGRAPAAAAPAAEPEAPAEVVPPHINAMLRSEDPATKQWGEYALAEHRATQERIGALEQIVNTQVVMREIVTQKQAEIDGVKGEFVMLAEVEQPGADGKPTKVVVEQPVTDAHMDEVADYYDAHPETVGVLSIEEVTRRLHPNMVKRSAKPTPAATPTLAPQDAAQRRVVKVGSPTAGPGVVANGSASGRVPRPAPPPPANETMEQAIDRGMKTLGVE